jgi:tetratricopeptide (TPR) repeat protein
MMDMLRCDPKTKMAVPPRVSALAAVLLAGTSLFSILCLGRGNESTPARLIVSTGREGCVVELDAAPAGKTDAKGVLTLDDVEPSDHYLHIRCPEQEQETAYFVSPHRGESVEIHPPAVAAPADAARPPLEAAEAKLQLRRDVQQAARQRGEGRLDEAVQLLHEAAKLDPENSDLHLELGVTFLLGKDWKRARVEMLEAIRHDPDDADAHNGLGYALDKLGDLDGALREYRTATHLEPDNESYRRHYLEALGKLAAKQAEKKK